MCYQPIQIKNSKFGLPNEPRYIMVNCRTCLECRQKRANEWALRCMAEAQKYEKNCFITLTYEKSPITLQKRDLQLFFKRFRKSIYPLKVKYFACGEYGSLHYRPHYHAIIFNYDFDDKFLWSKSKRGYPIFRSLTLEKLWSFGNSTIQSVTTDTCAYCALYSSPEKHTLPPHLWNAPEFNVMSKNLGTDLLLANMETYLKTDEIWLDGQAHNIPQYILDKYFGADKNNNSKYLELKRHRKSLFMNNTPSAEEFSNIKYVRENAKKRLQSVI